MADASGTSRRATSAYRLRPLSRRSILTVADFKQPAQTTVETTPQQNALQTSNAMSVFPTAETAVSWSLLRDSGASVPLGWNFSGAGNLTPWFGVVGDVTGAYKGFDFGFVDGYANTHTFLSGPRFTARLNGGRVNPFGQFLAGVE